MSTWRDIRRLVLKRDNRKCRICGKEGSGQIHHIIPKSKGGTDKFSNLITLCGRCHMLLSPMPDWIISKEWKIPLDEIDLERAKVKKALEKIRE